MSLATLERAILAELKQVAKNRKLRNKDILEWSTSAYRVKGNLRPDEQMIHLPALNVWCAIKK